jgi:hypothetical protein
MGSRRTMRNNGTSGRISRKIVDWRATADEGGNDSFAVAL